MAMAGAALIAASVAGEVGTVGLGSEVCIPGIVAGSLLIGASYKRTMDENNDAYNSGEEGTGAYVGNAAANAGGMGFLGNIGNAGAGVKTIGRASEVLGWGMLFYHLGSAAWDRIKRARR